MEHFLCPALMHGPEGKALQCTRCRRDCSTWNIWGGADGGLGRQSQTAGIDPL